MMRFVMAPRLLPAAVFRAMICLALIGCTQTTPSKQAKKGAEMTITVTSTAFSAGQAIPKKHTGEGENVSLPLKWSNLPAETKEMALICDDPDAPGSQPWVHWVIYKISAGTGGLPENVEASPTPAVPAGAMQGPNDSGKTGYSGPMPPRGHGMHHYHFKVYALDARLNLRPGLTKSDLLKAMEGHVLAQGELVGTYERK